MWRGAEFRMAWIDKNTSMYEDGELDSTWATFDAPIQNCQHIDHASCERKIAATQQFPTDRYTSLIAVRTNSVITARTGIELSMLGRPFDRPTAAPEDVEDARVPPALPVSNAEEESPDIRRPKGIIPIAPRPPPPRPPPDPATLRLRIGLVIIGLVVIGLVTRLSLSISPSAP